MKKLLIGLLCLSFTSVLFAKSKIIYMDDIAATLLANEKEMGKVLQQFKSETHKDPKTGVVLQKIIWIEQGSAWEKAGVKIGDFLANGKAPRTK